MNLIVLLHVLCLVITMNNNDP